MKRVHSFTVPSASGGAAKGAVGEGTSPSVGSAVMAWGAGTRSSGAAPVVQEGILQAMGAPAVEEGRSFLPVG